MVVAQLAEQSILSAEGLNSNPFVNEVVAQLVKQSLPTPEIHGSNPVIGKFIYSHL